MTRPLTADEQIQAIHAGMPAAFSLEQPVRKLVSETTDRGGTVRLEYWPDDGYVLWYHGRAVWKSWKSE